MVKQKDCEDADERVKAANESADRIEAYIKSQNDTLVDLEAENSKLKQLLEKAYDFMKQFMKDGRSLLDWFMESVEQAVKKVGKLEQVVVSQHAPINIKKNKCLQTVLAIIQINEYNIEYE